MNDDYIASWAEFADDIERAFPGLAQRVRNLIPRLGDPHGPPVVGSVISGDALDRCPVGTLLRATTAGCAALRAVNGWQVTGMNYAQGRSFVKINEWRVVDISNPPLDR